MVIIFAGIKICLLGTSSPLSSLNAILTASLAIVSGSCSITSLSGLSGFLISSYASGLQEGVTITIWSCKPASLIACAAAQAIREAGLQDQIVIVTPSCSPLAYEEMRKTESPLKLVMEQDPDTMAREAVRMAFKLLNGEEVPRRHIFIPAKMITIENISESQFLK